MENNIDSQALFKLSYGLFVLSAKQGDKDNGCIINTVTQLTNTPMRISIAVNKANYTHDMIAQTGLFNVSVLTQSAPFFVYEQFGFSCGRTCDKFDGSVKTARAENGLLYLQQNANAVISAKVTQAIDCGTHTLFIADVTEAITLNDEKSVTYAYYFENVKPKPQAAKSGGKVWICKICSYVYDEAKEGVPFESLPEDWVCPLCKHPKSDFYLQA